MPSEPGNIQKYGQWGSFVGLPNIRAKLSLALNASQKFVKFLSKQGIYTAFPVPKKCLQAAQEQ